MVDAGEMRWRVAFDARAVISDGLGNSQGAFAEQFVCQAKIQARFGGEAIAAARLQGQQPVTITIRQSSRTREITTDWRARQVRNGQTVETYAIRSIVDPEGDRQFFEILCQTGVAT